MSQNTKFTSKGCNVTRGSLRTVGILCGAPRFDCREYTNTCFDKTYPYSRFIFFPIGDKYTTFNYTVVMKSTKPMCFKLCMMEVNESDASETTLVCIEDFTCESEKTFYINWSGRTGDSNKSYRLIFETTTCYATASLIRDYTNIMQFNTTPDIDEIPRVICPN